MAARKQGILDCEIVLKATVESFKKLHPVTMTRNPVMFVTEVGAVITTLYLLFRLLVPKFNLGTSVDESFAFELQIAL